MIAVAATQPAFVGRDDEIERVRRALDGHARLVVVEGEPGVGKTRLIDEALQRHDADPPLTVLRGTADRDSIRPLGAFVEALADGVAAWPTVPASVRRHGGAVVSLFGSRPGCRAGPELSAYEMHDGLLSVLSAQLEQHGALVLDDLHWADAETFTALGRVALSGIGCTMVVGARSDELPDGFFDVVEQIERRHDVARVHVGALRRDDVADLLRRTYGARAAANADAVHERTAGHPLLLMHLIESGALLEEDISALPSSAEESIRRRVTALRPTARDVLNDAAILGPVVRFDDLMKVGRRSDDLLTHALRQLCDRRLLVESDSDVFTFVHALTRQVVESTMLDRERRGTHRRVLDNLADDVAPARVLHHAIGAGDDDRACQAASAGAPLALAAGQPTRARDMALLATRWKADDSGLWAVLALASWQLRDRDEARRAAERALALAAGDVIMTARLRWLLARLALEALDTGRFRANLLELEALERVARGVDRAEVLTDCAELKMLSNEADEVVWGRRAVAAATGTPLEGRARVSLGSSLTNEPGGRSEGRAILTGIVDSRSCDSFHHAWALNNLLCDAVYAWPPDDVWPLIDQFERHVVATALYRGVRRIRRSVPHAMRGATRRPRVGPDGARLVRSGRTRAVRVPRVGSRPARTRRRSNRSHVPWRRRRVGHVAPPGRPGQARVVRCRGRRGRNSRWIGHRPAAAGAVVRPRRRAGPFHDRRDRRPWAGGTSTDGTRCGQCISDARSVARVDRR